MRRTICALIAVLALSACGSSGPNIKKGEDNGMWSPELRQFIYTNYGSDNQFYFARGDFNRDKIWDYHISAEMVGGKWGNPVVLTPQNPGFLRAMEDFENAYGSE